MSESKESTINIPNNREDINIICRQTNYNREEAEQELDFCKGNVEQVVLQYITGSKSTLNPPKAERSGSINQEIYKQIRTVMDDGGRAYRNRSEDRGVCAFTKK